MPKRDEMPIAQLEQGILIDEDALDEALIQQPDLFHRVAKKLALAISERDAAKNELVLVEAKADEGIRHDADVNDEKVTEPSIKAAVQLDKNVRKIKDTLKQLSLDVSTLSALERAYEQRLKALGHLTNLYIAGYFGDVTPRARGNDLSDHRADRARAALHKLRTQAGARKRKDDDDDDE